MADCYETLRELQTYLDGELPSEVRVVVDEHLLECTDCLQAFDFHAELKQVVRAKAQQDELPPDLLDRLSACLGDLDDADPVG